MRIFIAFLFLSVSIHAFEPRPVTPYPVVGFKEISFFDASQQKTRSLLIWYPVKPQTAGRESPNEWDQFKIATNAPINSSQSKMPLVVISHGYGGTPHQLSWLIKKLIYNNYIVLAMQHSDFLNGKPHANHWQRAQDIHGLIDLFSSNAISSSADLKRIGVAGFSLGGTTALWLAGGRTTNLSTIAPSPEYASQQEFSAVDQVLPSLDRKKMSQDWKDSRIKSAFLMAPAWAWIFDEQSLKEVSIPTFIVAPEKDRLLVTKNNAGFFAKNIPGALYQAIPGDAGHYIFISQLNEAERKTAKISPNLNFLLQDNPSVDRSWIQFQVAEEAVKFFNESL